MPENELKSTTSFDASRFLPVLLLLFAASGCSALIYEIVWYQLLQLAIGSTAVSLGVLLATFMGGLCAGSLALPRILARRWQHPLLVYALIEAGIGACGILVLFGMPLIDGIYSAGVGHGMPAILLRAMVCAVCLMPPTLLMGASLPAIARWIETSPRGVAWLGLLYGANTAGAVAGCLLAGFYLLRVFDMATATLVAAAINGLVALGSWYLSRTTPRRAPAEEPGDSAAPSGAGRWRFEAVYVTIALSGATALGAEVVWTRLLGLLFGATVYTFSIILAIFLAGIGLGSGAGSMLSRSTRPRTALGICQLLLAGAIAWTAFTLSRSLPYWPVNPLLSGSPWITFQVDMARAVWTILPATLCWGASFPLALAAVARRESDPGRLVGGVYAANTFGAILGALAFSMILIPRMGTQQCQRALMLLAALSALFALGPVAWRARSKPGVLAGLAASLGALAFSLVFVPWVGAWQPADAPMLVAASLGWAAMGVLLALPLAAWRAKGKPGALAGLAASLGALAGLAALIALFVLSLAAWQAQGGPGAPASGGIRIPWVGTLACPRAVLALAALGCLLALCLAAWRAPAKLGALAGLAASLGALGCLAAGVAPVPGNLIAYGRRMITSAAGSELLYVGEGMNSSIAITRWNDGAVQFHVSGKVEASTEPYDMRLQRMLGHLPALVHPRPQSVLIVGFGAGVTAGTFVLHPDIRRIAVCEMEPIIPPAAARFFARENYDVMNDPRTRIYYDDARHFVLTTRDKFDIVTSDPIHPWVKGSATLYSREYFELVRERLNPGGVVTQWVPLYESDANVVKSEIATFFEVFPGGSIWANELNGGGYDVFLLGQQRPGRIDVDAIEARLEEPAYARAAESLREVGLGTAVELFSTYAGQDRDLKPWLLGAEINHDGNLRLQYMAGLAVNANAEQAIYGEMLKYRQFPSNLLAGSGRTLETLEAALSGGGR